MEQCRVAALTKLGLLPEEPDWVPPVPTLPAMVGDTSLLVGHLIHLNLAGNPIYEQGLAGLVNALLWDAHLTDLNLSDCCIAERPVDSVGMVGLGIYQAEGRRDVPAWPKQGATRPRDNGPDDLHAAFSTGKRRQKPHTSDGVDDCGACLAGVRALALLLGAGGNRTITSLDLSGNALTGFRHPFDNYDGVTAIGQALLLNGSKRADALRHHTEMDDEPDARPRTPGGSLLKQLGSKMLMKKQGVSTRLLLAAREGAADDAAAAAADDDDDAAVEVAGSPKKGKAGGLASLLASTPPSSTPTTPTNPKARLMLQIAGAKVVSRPTTPTIGVFGAVANAALAGKGSAQGLRRAARAKRKEQDNPSGSVGGGIVKLRIGRNHLGPGGVEPIAKALEKAHTMTHLDLHDNHMEHGGLLHISRALHSCKSLRSLDLSNNWVGRGVEGNHLAAEATAALAQALAACKLERLDLSANELREECYAVLCSTLKYHKTLKELGLAHNYLGEASAHAIVCDMLIVNQSLTSVDLSGNALGGSWNFNHDWKPNPARVHQLCNCLRFNTRLLKVDLTQNGFARPVQRALFAEFGTRLLLRDDDIGGAEDRAYAETQAALLRLPDYLVHAKRKDMAAPERSAGSSGWRAAEQKDQKRRANLPSRLRQAEAMATQLAAENKGKGIAGAMRRLSQVAIDTTKMVAANAVHNVHMRKDG
jgi:Ran GTPase-activating protein (RanGAP) involved in mRNA processing and transport